MSLGKLEPRAKWYALVLFFVCEFEWLSWHTIQVFVLYTKQYFFSTVFITTKVFAEGTPWRMASFLCESITFYLPNFAQYLYLRLFKCFAVVIFCGAIFLEWLICRDDLGSWLSQITTVISGTFIAQDILVKKYLRCLFDLLTFRWSAIQNLLTNIMHPTVLYIFVTHFILYIVRTLFVF